MSLTHLTINGFKSFIPKITLDFCANQTDRHSITAIVGPNGSGKSNIADAIRWVLGEQNAKLLRCQTTEDLLFAGSKTKNRANFTEVSARFNNENRQIPIEYAEVSLTRRHFRGGESDYTLNGNKMKLNEILLLLSQANIGTKNFSIISQGMIDSIILYTPAQRLEFFKESVGIKPYIIKRTQTLNKLEKTEYNMAQAKSNIQEIEPNLKAWEKQVKKLNQRNTLETELKTHLLEYYSRLKTQIDQELKEKQDRLTALGQEYQKHAAGKDSLTAQIETLERESLTFDDFSRLQHRYQQLSSQKNKLIEELAHNRTQKETCLLKQNNLDLTWVNQKKNEILLLIEQKQKEAQSLNLQKQKLHPANIEMYKDKFKEKILSLCLILESFLNKFTRIQQVKDLDELRTQSSKIYQESQNIKNQLTRQSAGQIKALDEKIHWVAHELEQLHKDLNNLRTPLPQEIQQSLDSFDKQISAAEKDINRVAGELAALEKTLNEYGQKEETKRKQLLDLGQRRQNIQKEINDFESQKHQLDLEIARLETKKENLEMDIVKKIGSLNLMNGYQPYQPQWASMDTLEIEKKIEKYKNQIEFIGGIDPEASKEYSALKEKYDFFAAQMADINSAIQSLESIIQELDAKIDQQFENAFSEINQGFETCFKQIFGGGRARLSRCLAQTDSEANDEQTPNPYNSIAGKYQKKKEAGIMIQASPSGKKIENIEMLSGGEKALTAISLIAAMIRYNPTPLVLWDEVDASLDESNSRKLTSIIKELSQKTQFIMITHNRSLMEIADMIYGVTMADNTSKLVSIKLSLN
ncbi:MAG: AAA family ATPase [Parcubacteria group bacterium]|nr:AAA family ATPase [Parcubacteria group bacterium]